MKGTKTSICHSQIQSDLFYSEKDLTSLCLYIYFSNYHTFFSNKQGNAQADRMHANLAIFPTTSKEIVEMEWQLNLTIEPHVFILMKRTIVAGLVLIDPCLPIITVTLILFIFLTYQSVMKLLINFSFQSDFLKLNPNLPVLSWLIKNVYLVKNKVSVITVVLKYTFGNYWFLLKLKKRSLLFHTCYI